MVQISKIFNLIKWKVGFPKRMIYKIGLAMIRYARQKVLAQFNNEYYVKIKDREIESAIHFQNHSIQYKIVIITFSKRILNSCLLLIKELRSSGIAQQIFVGINGDLDKSYESSIRQKFFREISELQDVNVVCFGNFESLAKMWNRTIQATGSEIVIVLNDDIIVDKKEVAKTFDILAKRAQKYGICLLNSDWAHFAISKDALIQVGWFDERFLGIGEEDGDFSYRFEETFGQSVFDFSLWRVGLTHDTSDVFDENLAKGKRKYSLFNWVFSEKKYQIGKGTIKGMSNSTMLQTISDKIQFPYEIWERQLSGLRSENSKAVIDKEIDNFFRNNN